MIPELVRVRSAYHSHRQPSVFGIDNKIVSLQVYLPRIKTLILSICTGDSTVSPSLKSFVDGQIPIPHFSFSNLDDFGSSYLSSVVPQLQLWGLLPGTGRTRPQRVVFVTPIETCIIYCCRLTTSPSLTATLHSFVLTLLRQFLTFISFVGLHTDPLRVHLSFG